MELGKRSKKFRSINANSVVASFSCFFFLGLIAETHFVWLSNLGLTFHFVSFVNRLSTTLSDFNTASFYWRVKFALFSDEKKYFLGEDSLKMTQNPKKK